MSGAMDEESLPPGLGHALLADGARPTPGLGADLSPRGSEADPGSARALIFALQHLSAVQGSPDAYPRTPTPAPPAIGTMGPQAADAPDRPLHSAPYDMAMLSDAIEAGRPDLGLLGNTIRGALSLLSGGYREFTPDLFENYWLGKGDVKLNGNRFQDIVDNTRSLAGGKPVFVTGPHGEPLRRVQYHFSGSPDYQYSLGTASLFYDSTGNPVGFYDRYNFDHAPGKRGGLAELETDVMRLLKPSSAKPFDLSYGTYAPPN